MLSAIALWMELPAASVWIFISIYFFLSILAFRHVCLTLSTVPSHYVNISGTFTSWFMFSCVFAHTQSTPQRIARPFQCGAGIQSAKYLFVSAPPIHTTEYMWAVCRMEHRLCGVSGANPENWKKNTNRYRLQTHRSIKSTESMYCSWCQYPIHFAIFNTQYIYSIRFRFQFYPMTVAYAVGATLISRSLLFDLSLVWQFHPIRKMLICCFATHSHFSHEAYWRRLPGRWVVAMKGIKEWMLCMYLWHISITWCWRVSYPLRPTKRVCVNAHRARVHFNRISRTQRANPDHSRCTLRNHNKLREIQSLYNKLISF